MVYCELVGCVVGCCYWNFCIVLGVGCVDIVVLCDWVFIVVCCWWFVCGRFVSC